MAIGKNKVLGRGLANLIPGSDKPDSPSGEAPREVKISEITPNPYQPRKTFSPESLQELANTIQSHGVIQPIVVRKKDQGYVLVSGERRLRAAKLAGFQKIPVVIRNYSDTEMMEIAILENLQREDLNPIEEAVAYQTLMERLSLKVTDLAARLGKNRATVSNTLRLLSFPAQIQQLVKEGKITEGQVRPLLSLGDAKKQVELSHKIIQEQWSARAVEDHISKILHPEKRKETKPIAKDPSVSKIETKLRNALSAKVSVQHSEKKGNGKITVFYNSLEEMERVLEKVGIKP